MPALPWPYGMLLGDATREGGGGGGAPPPRGKAGIIQTEKIQCGPET